MSKQEGGKARIEDKKEDPRVKELTDELRETQHQLHKYLMISHSEERLGAKLANYIAAQGVVNEKVRFYLGQMTNEELLRTLGI